jgi:hypothetical protein
MADALPSGSLVGKELRDGRQRTQRGKAATKSTVNSPRDIG